MTKSVTRILVPPGIGDGYWVLVKLRGWLQKNRIAIPEIWVHDAGPRRAHGMWQRVPFVRFGGYAAVPRRGSVGGKPLSADRQALKRAYQKPNYPVQARVCGYDYLLSFNGALDNGVSLDGALPNCPANWYERAYDEGVTGERAEDYRARFGDYVVAAFWDHGFYRKFLDGFGEDKIVATLRALADAGKTVVIMGADWDRGAIADRIAAADDRFVNLIGATDYDDLTGLLSGSDAVVGFPAGNTMLGPYFRRPTVLLWHDHFPRAMWTHACPPDATNYYALDTRTAKPEQVVDCVLGRLTEAAA